MKKPYYKHPHEEGLTILSLCIGAICIRFCLHCNIPFLASRRGCNDIAATHNYWMFCSPLCDRTYTQTALYRHHHA